MNALKSHAAGTTDSDVFEKLPQALGMCHALVTSRTFGEAAATEFDGQSNLSVNLEFS